VIKVENPDGGDHARAANNCRNGFLALDRKNPAARDALLRLIGDFDLAEELVQDAIVEALEHWPRDGLPERPGAWLMATARRKAIDRARREARGREKLAQLAASEPPASAGYEPEDRLRLIFTCCHPALARDAQVALTLRAVAGLTTGQIARAFLVSEATVAQRIVRAKRKIVEAGIPYRVPEGRHLCERIDVPTFHIPMITSARIDQFRSYSQLGPSMPKEFRTLLTNPPCVPNICCHMYAVPTPDATAGM